MMVVPYGSGSLGITDRAENSALTSGVFKVDIVGIGTRGIAVIPDGSVLRPNDGRGQHREGGCQCGKATGFNNGYFYISSQVYGLSPKFDPTKLTSLTTFSHQFQLVKRTVSKVTPKNDHLALGQNRNLQS